MQTQQDQPYLNTKIKYRKINETYTSRYFVGVMEITNLFQNSMNVFPFFIRFEKEEPDDEGKLFLGLYQWMQSQDWTRPLMYLDLNLSNHELIDIACQAINPTIIVGAREIIEQLDVNTGIILAGPRMHQ